MFYVFNLILYHIQWINLRVEIIAAEKKKCVKSLKCPCHISSGIKGCMQKSGLPIFSQLYNTKVHNAYLLFPNPNAFWRDFFHHVAFKGVNPQLGPWMCVSLSDTSLEQGNAKKTPPKSLPLVITVQNVNCALTVLIWPFSFHFMGLPGKRGYKETGLKWNC